MAIACSYISSDILCLLSGILKSEQEHYWNGLGITYFVKFFSIPEVLLFHKRMLDSNIKRNLFPGHLEDMRVSDVRECNKDIEKRTAINKLFALKISMKCLCL